MLVGSALGKTMNTLCIRKTHNHSYEGSIFVNLKKMKPNQGAPLDKPAELDGDEGCQICRLGWFSPHDLAGCIGALTNVKFETRRKNKVAMQRMWGNMTSKLTFLFVKLENCWCSLVADCRIGEKSCITLHTIELVNS
jgi:hypothetical protein